MPINPSFVGRTFHGSRPYEVSVEKIRSFCVAVGEPVGTVAPPTFPTVIDLAIGGPAFLEDPQSGIEIIQVVHGEQRYEYERPLVAGDVVSLTTVVHELSARGGNEYLTLLSEFRAADGELICRGYNTIVSRGTAAPEPEST